MAFDNLRIETLSDREFLLVVADHTQEDGWADSLAIAQAFGFEERKVAAGRFRWLREYGAVEREHERDAAGNLRWHKSGKPMHTQRWRLTELGEAVAHGRLRKGDQTALDRLTEAQLPLITRWLSEHSRGDTGMAKLVQREWRYGHARRDGQP